MAACKFITSPKCPSVVFTKFSRHKNFQIYSTNSCDLEQSCSMGAFKACLLFTERCCSEFMKMLAMRARAGNICSQCGVFLNTCVCILRFNIQRRLLVWQNCQQPSSPSQKARLQSGHCLSGWLVDWRFVGVRTSCPVLQKSVKAKSQNNKPVKFECYNMF